MKISIIGVGSLGGFLAYEISQIDFKIEMTIIDFDYVKERNLRNSIYSKDDVEKLKTIALKNILENKSDKIIRTINDSYNGSNINFKDEDLIIDCRDILVPDDKNISFKCYISGRYLIIDCKKTDFEDKIYDGSYSYEISKYRIKKATRIISELILENKINNMIKKGLIYKFDLDYMDKIIECENNLSEGSENILSDRLPSLKKCRNLDDLGYKIFEYNDKDDIYIHDHRGNMKKYEKNSIKTMTNLSNILNPILNAPFSKQAYFINIVKKENKIIIEIIPASGGA